MTQTFNALVEAVQSTGKKFNEISKESIFDFLDRRGEPRSTWDPTYQKLSEVFERIEVLKKKSNSNISSDVPDTSSGINSVVDYNNNSHNDVKIRQPRKSIFSDIKKIAG